ncbi:unnamed protein product [Miscanthus lutarioriparius]|uniref:Uncharacterized protein n=1 Tax=Miscanthus lutarioriparius TaxID=422564 RepID=A0A811SIH5_9POAL|nr:unnamed protein product [Miscanthus lutarioriparius]
MALSELQARARVFSRLVTAAKTHGGGKQCNFGGGCEKFARGRSGLCAAHGTLVASQQSRGGGGMISQGLFHGIVRSASSANMNSDYSSSGVSTVSDRGGSPEAATRRQGSSGGEDEVLDSNFGEPSELQHFFFVSRYVLGRLEN